MTEDDELMARIGFLAGQINRHKSQSHHTGRGGYSGAPYGSQHIHHRGSPGWRPYRGRSRAAPRPLPGPHRHRTLVLNGQNAASDSASATPSADVSNDDVSNAKATQKDGWVSKRDRHMQLINTSIYDQETQARQKAIEETMKQKTQKKAEIEKAKVIQHAQRNDGPQFSNTTGGNQDSKSYTIFVNDIPFRIAQGGGKLIRLSSERAFGKDKDSRAGLPFLDDPTMANATPKRTKVGGVTFVRSKNGNLHRLGAVVSKKYGLIDGDTMRRAQLDELTFKLRQPMVKKKSELCKRFTSMGTCFKGPSCPYIHDPNKVAICKEFLQTGKCDAGDACDLSHEPSPERSPACVHFIRGRCSNPTCRYAHVRVTPGAPVCRDFAVLGYCSKGSTCGERHVHECPDYANTGKCDNKRCPLPHIDRAGQIRKLASTNKTDAEGASDEDISSEEETYDQIDSDDIDSDDYDEPEMIISKPDTGEVSEQKDFIQF